MEVILKEDVEKLGYRGDTVSVKSGYARNYLVPQGLAINATPSAKKQMAETMKQRAHKELKIKEIAEKLLAGVQAAEVKVPAKVGENGKIFGSVTSVQVAEAIAKLGHTVERRHINLKGDAVKTVGTYEAELKLHKEVSGIISFEVVAG